jgi:hypothetical protein
VCKRGAPPPLCKRLTVFRKIRIEQIFQSRTRSRLLFASRRNADELRLFAARRCLLFCFFNASRRASHRRFQSGESVGSNKFTKAKIFCAEPPEKALGRATRSAKRTNRCRRFVFAAPSEVVWGRARRRRAADFSSSAIARSTRAAKFRRAGGDRRLV